MVASFHRDGCRIAIEQKLGVTGKHDDPFVFVLFIPVPLKRTVTGRYDAFDADDVTLH